MQTNFSYATTSCHALALTSGYIAGLVAAYLASGKTIRVYATAARALPSGAINRATTTGRKPAFYCIHNPIAEHANP